MKENTSNVVRRGFCIFINTFFHGDVPLVSDENGYCIFETELDAQKEIADYAITRLQQFIDGERDFADAMTVEEFVVSITLYADGTLVDSNGNRYSSRPD